MLETQKTPGDKAMRSRRSNYGKTAKTGGMEVLQEVRVFSGPRQSPPKQTKQHNNGAVVERWAHAYLSSTIGDVVAFIRRHRLSLPTGFVLPEVPEEGQETPGQRKRGMAEDTEEKRFLYNILARNNRIHKEVYTKPQ